MPKTALCSSGAHGAHVAISVGQAVYRAGQDRYGCKLFAVEHVITISQRRVHVTETTAITGAPRIAVVVPVGRATRGRVVIEVRF